MTDTTVKTKKADLMRGFAADALARVLNGIESNHPGKYTIKANLIPLVARRANQIMGGEEYTVDFDLQAIPSPDDKFIRSHWSRICKICARKHKVYPVWDNGFIRGGYRMGTLEEYQNNQHVLRKINYGIRDSISDRTNIIIGHGGKSFKLEVTTRELLGPGDLTEQRDT